MNYPKGLFTSVISRTIAIAITWTIAIFLWSETEITKVVDTGCYDEFWLEFLPSRSLNGPLALRLCLLAFAHCEPALSIAPVFACLCAV